MPRRPATHRPHGPQRPEGPRPSAHARGYGRRWRRFRLAFLAQHPLCVACREKGLLVAAEHVDHVRPVKGPDDPGFYRPGNHQSLCASCHSTKTATEDGGFGR